MSYIQNYVEIKIIGERPQKFINICLRRRLAIWKLERVSAREFTLCMLAGDFKKNVRSAARKSHIKNFKKEWNALFPAPLSLS